MSSENHSEAFFSADEDVNIASRSSSLRNSILSSGDTFVKQESSSVPPQRCVSDVYLCFNTDKNEICRKKFSSELSIVTDRNGLPARPIQAPGSAPETGKLRLSTHRSDHEIHTPEHRTVQGLVTPYKYATCRSVSPRILASNGAHASSLFGTQESSHVNDVLNDSSDSVSNTSYASAVGSQEDFTLVDLHTQVCFTSTILD